MQYIDNIRGGHRVDVSRRADAVAVHAVVRIHIHSLLIAVVQAAAFIEIRREHELVARLVISASHSPVHNIGSGFDAQLAASAAVIRRK